MKHLLSVALCVASATFAEVRAQSPASSFTPSRPNSVALFNQISLNNFWVAKISDDGKLVRLIRPKYKNEVAEATIVMPRKTIQTSSKIVDGKEITSQVEVWSTIEERNQYYLNIPDGNQKFAVPLDEVSAFLLNGTEVKQPQLQLTLKTPKHVFVYFNRTEKFEGLDAYHQSAFRNDVLVLRLPTNIEVDEKYRERAQTSQ